MLGSKGQKPTIWQSDAYNFAPQFDGQSETDVIHSFIKTLSLRNYRIDSQQIFDVPARALIGLNRNTTERVNTQPPSFEAKIDLDVSLDEVSGHFTLQYSLLTYENAPADSGLFKTILSKAANAA